MTLDLAEQPPTRAVSTIAGPFLYQGTAGIGMFLGELHRVTGEREFGRAAGGALRHAVAACVGDGAAPSFGLYAGHVGVAHAAVRFASACGADDLLEGAEHLLRRLRGQERADRGLDVIAGAGGAIGALLATNEVLERDWVRAMAIDLGEHLLRTARYEPIGISWDSEAMPHSARNLTGFAHGASGIAFGLLQLVRATGSDAFRYAAEQAIRYERQFFDEDVGNWPDLRHEPLQAYARAHYRAPAGCGATEQPPPAYTRHYMRAWCHGSPGIGLVRLRAYELLGEDEYRVEALRALRAAESSDPRDDWNYSLCHGRLGNCELPLEAARVLGEPSLASPALVCAERARDAFEGRGAAWPCGTLGAVSDPSLMLGEAGIGHFFLRLAEPRTPSVLLIEAACPGAANAAGAAPSPRREHIDAYFGRALPTFRTLGMDPSGDAADAPAGDPGADVRLHGGGPDVVYARCCEAVARARDAGMGAALHAAFLPERRAYEKTLGLADWTDCTVRDLRRAPADVVRWDVARLALAADAELLEPFAGARETAHAGHSADGAHDLPRTEQPAHHVVVRAGRRYYARPLRPFAVAVLSALRTPVSLEDLVDAVGGSVEANVPLSRPALRSLVLQQVIEAYRGGLVDAHDG